MAICPNKNRKRALMGGHPGCQGKLEIVVMVPVSLGVRRMPKGCEDVLDVVNKTAQKSHRVNWRTIMARIESGDCDVRCDTCGWSLKAMGRGLQARKKTKR